VDKLQPQKFIIKKSEGQERSRMGIEKEEHLGKRNFTGKKQRKGGKRRDEDWRQRRKHKREG
jgi:hypothetical protein